jgi:hypothetical protein
MARALAGRGGAGRWLTMRGGCCVQERRLAQEAIKKAEEARLRREAEAQRLKELQDRELQERRRIEAEQARLAAEPTFNVATVPVNKLRPFFFFSTSHQSGVKPFMVQQDTFDIHLCARAGTEGKGKLQRLSSASVSLAPFIANLERRKEFIAHFRSEGLSDTFIRVTLGLEQVKEVVSPGQLPLELMAQTVWVSRDVDWCPCEPLPHGWMASCLSAARRTALALDDEDRALKHDIAKEELQTKEAAALELSRLREAAEQQPANADPGSQENAQKSSAREKLADVSIPDRCVHAHILSMPIHVKKRCVCARVCCTCTDSGAEVLAVMLLTSRAPAMAGLQSTLPPRRSTDSHHRRHPKTALLPAIGGSSFTFREYFALLPCAKVPAADLAWGALTWALSLSMRSQNGSGAAADQRHMEIAFAAQRRREVAADRPAYWYAAICSNS